MLFPETLFKNLADLLDAQCIKESGRHLYGFLPMRRKKFNEQLTFNR